ncbi:hypothetical protein XPA_009565 [Xanthoria parietina]
MSPRKSTTGSAAGGGYDLAYYNSSHSKSYLRVGLLLTTPLSSAQAGNDDMTALRSTILRGLPVRTSQTREPGLDIPVIESLYFGISSVDLIPIARLLSL